VALECNPVRFTYAHAVLLVAACAGLVGEGVTAGVRAVVSACYTALPGVPATGDLMQVVARRSWGDVVSTSGVLMSYADFEDIRNAAGPRVPMSAVGTVDGVVQWKGETRQLRGLAVSTSFQALTGVRSVLGGAIPGDSASRAGGLTPIVLTHVAWSTVFRSDPGIIGDSVLLDAVWWRVVGVTEPSFRGLGAGPIDFLIPIAMIAKLRPETDWLTSRRASWIEVIARPSSTQAAVVASARLKHFQTSTIEPRVDPRPRVSLLAWRSCSGLLAPVASRQALAQAAAATLLVVLLCLVYAWLVTGTAVEIARESRLLSVTAVAVALAIAFGARVLDGGFGSEGYVATIAIAWAATVLSLAAAEGTAIIGQRVGRRISEPSPTAPRGTTSAWRMGLSAGVVGLLAGCGMIFGLAKLGSRRAVVGMDVERVLVSAGVGEQANQPVANRAMREALVDRIRRTPGVTEVAVAEQVPFVSVSGVPVRATNFPRVRKPGSGPYINRVSPGYFAALGIPVLRGRVFAPSADEHDRAVINASFAKHYFRGADPIGQCLTVGRPTVPARCTEVIGIVADAKYLRMDEEPIPHLYAALSRDAALHGGMSVLVRTQQDAADYLVEGGSALGRIAIQSIGRPLLFQTLDGVLAPQRATVDAGWRSFRLLALAAIGLFAVLMGTERRRLLGCRWQHVSGRDRDTPGAVTSDDDVAEKAADADALTLPFAATVLGLALGAGLARYGMSKLIAAGGAPTPSLLTVVWTVAMLLGIGALAWILAARAAETLSGLSQHDQIHAA